VEKIRKTLEEGKLANQTDLDFKNEYTEIAVKELSLLTMKPFLFVYNVSDVNERLSDELENRLHVKLDIKIEEELNEMSSEEIKEMELQSNINELILKSYELLGLITFLTTGEDESRAWTVKNGSTAPESGAAIHNDFKDRFIRADVIFWDKLLESGSWSKARELGWIRTEGKKYVVRDGDVLEFKIF
jgi:hypothetical protein